MVDDIQIAGLIFRWPPDAAQGNTITEAVIVQLQSGKIAVSYKWPAELPVRKGLEQNLRADPTRVTHRDSIELSIVHSNPASFGSGRGHQAHRSRPPS